MVDTLLQYAPEHFDHSREAREHFTQVVDQYKARDPESQDQMRILQFYHLLKAADTLPPGDYVELGTHIGLTLRVIYQFMDRTQQLYSLDTFKGFDQRDLNVENGIYKNEWHAGNFSPTNAEAVARYVGDGTPPSNLTMVEGWFPHETFGQIADKQFRFAHIDMDLYEPTRAALDLLWPRMVPGGIMLMHDYGCFGFPACRIAINRFCSRIGLAPVMLCDRSGSAVLRKPLR